MPPPSAARFIQSSTKPARLLLELRLRVKPGASKTRQGITAVGPDAIELCVAAQAKDGEANKAAIQVLSSVLGVPKTSFQLTRGIKARDKTVLLDGWSGDGEEQVRKVLQMLHKAAE
ncbi:hypothetical protein S40285_02336 [Stachybotrys chlorohalonatus IBT 40285]|jgi:uncharacterized protein YggU (UPF0235/DUF167 family)|uniref:Uncharacterized protein n=1 Tax=Stachybotrys chlorohalonatus (strain IBT 40285) TaxID=1283841 RepID=A0A084QSC7_STAC4|nr:hypothetical protein S40285_02336 [Stachybotrys chlorohalonata IBT 40285]